MTTDTEQERPNWVARRAACTLEAKFHELAEVMRFDIDQINKQPCQARHRQLFDMTKEDMPPCFRVRRYPAERPSDCSGYVTVKLSRKKLEIHSPTESFEVCPRWNERDLTCDLFIDDAPYDVWRISQKALGDFFFDA